MAGTAVIDSGPFEIHSTVNTGRVAIFVGDDPNAHSLTPTQAMALIAKLAAAVALITSEPKEDV